MNSDVQDEILKQILYDAVSEEVEKSYSQEEKSTNDNILKNKKEKKHGDSKTVKILKYDIKVKTILMLIVALLVNTYAWFIYISTVSMDLSMHIQSWLFEFSESEDEVVIAIDHIYPGMPTVVKTITGTNMGEMSADMTVELSSLRIFDNTYNVGDTYTDSGGIQHEYTSEGLIQSLQEDYPFKVNIYIGGVLYDGTKIALATGDSKEVKYEVLWPYEGTTDTNTLASYDATDTQYGNDAYYYYLDHLNDPNNDVAKYPIFIKLEMKAQQSSANPIGNTTNTTNTTNP